MEVHFYSGMHGPVPWLGGEVEVGREGEYRWEDIAAPFEFLTPASKHLSA